MQWHTWAISFIIIFGWHPSRGQWLLTIDESYRQSFDQLPLTGEGANDALPTGWSFIEQGAAADQHLVAGDGSSPIGNTYSFGTNSDRALGTLLSGSLRSTIIFTFQNTSLHTVQSMRVRYRAERWRVGSLDRPDRLDFQYRMDTTGTSWIDCDSLDMIVYTQATSVGAADGQTPDHSQSIEALLNGIRLPPNAVGQFRWIDWDAVGSDDGLAIEDFEVEPSLITQNYFLSIAGARTKNVGAVVTVAGRVSSTGTFGDLHFIQDRSGGIGIFSSSFGSKHVNGDSIAIRGRVHHHQGMVEIIPDSSWEVATATRHVIPKWISSNDLRLHEGQFVIIKQLTFDLAGTFFYPGAGIANHDSSAFEYWVDEHTDIPGKTIPDEPIDLMGIVGRFKDRYQLMPRGASDFGIKLHSSAANHSFVPGSVRVMNWNVQFFGASRQQYGLEYGPSNESVQLTNVARIIQASRADIIALQEVSDPALFDALVDQLPGFEGRCSKRFSHSNQPAEFPPQRLCFIYRSNVTKVVSERVMFERLYDDAKTQDLLSDYPEGPASFFSSGRLPYVIEFEVANGGKSRRWSFINLHAKSGSSAADYARRVYDARVLNDTLSEWSGKDFILLGDFNDEIEKSIRAGEPSPYQPLSSELKLGCLTCPLSAMGWHSTVGFSDMIDHQLASPTLLEQVVTASTRIVNTFAEVKRFSQTTSDHLPILTELNPSAAIELNTSQDPSHQNLVYPNPFSDDALINCRFLNSMLPKQTKQLEARIFYLTGQSVRISSGTCEALQLAFSKAVQALAPGLYIVRIDADGFQFSSRLVKTK